MWNSATYNMKKEIHVNRIHPPHRREAITEERYFYAVPSQEGPRVLSATYLSSADFYTYKLRYK